MPSTLGIIYPQQQVFLADGGDSKYTVTFIDPNTGYVESTNFPSKIEADKQLALYGGTIDSTPSIAPIVDCENDGINELISSQYQNADSPFTGSSGDPITDIIRTSLSQLVHVSDNELDFQHKKFEYLNGFTDPSIV